MTETISITDEVVETVTRRLHRTRDDLRAASTDLRSLQEEVMGGAGEFADDLSDHVGDFQRAWRRALETHAESAEAIVAVTQAQQRDVGAVDAGR